MTPSGQPTRLIERSLDEIALRGRILLVNQGGIFPALIKERGLASCRVEQTRCGGHSAARHGHPRDHSTPPSSACPRPDEQDMTAHAVLSVLGPRRAAHRLWRQ